MRRSALDGRSHIMLVTCFLISIAVRDSIIIGIAASCVFLLAVAFIGSLIYRSVCQTKAR